MKSNSGAKKRFKVTGSGKIKSTLVTKADEAKVKELIPNKF